MAASSSPEITRLLHDFSGGSRNAFDELVPIVYEELHRLARQYIRHESADATICATELVHEAYMKLVDQQRTRWKDRAHFYAIAAQAMRRILIDQARSRKAGKRGGGQPVLQLDACGDIAIVHAEELIVLDEALSRLAAIDPRQSRVVECRYFAGLTIEETAEVLGISPTTVKQDWSLAKAWLFREMRRELSP